MNYQPTPGGVLAPAGHGQLQAGPQARPLKPYDDREADWSRDFAARGSFSLYALERMLTDCADQPMWRLRAKLCAAYYDGKQLDQLRKQLLLAEGLDERIVNLIRPIINSVLGQEAKSRTDVRIDFDDDGMADVAEVISGRLKELERETFAHQAVSNAYASMVKKGLGWLHVCRNSDPLAYPYRFEDVPIEEVWWDWRGMGNRTRLDDRCRWLCRMRMIDLDELEASMPQFRDVLRRSADGWAGWRMDASSLLGEPDDIRLTEAFENELRFNANFHKWDWYDTARKMVKVVEVWYRVPATCVCMVLSPSKKVLFDEKNPRHVEAVRRGLVKLVKGVTSQVRRALYAGPHRLLDEATNRKGFPYIPMFAYRDDDDGSPYGMVDGMIAPQDDYNDRRHRIQWMLKARQLVIDNDAVDPQFNSIADLADTVNRPDFVAVLNANRRNGGNAFQIGNTLQLQKEQFELLGISEMDVQKAAGRYGSNLGDAQVQSGIANSILVEQGEQAMGEMNDNYAYARRSSFEYAVDLIIEDHSQPDMKATIGQGRSRRTVILNTFVPVPATGPDGQPVVDQATGQPVIADYQPQNFVAEADIRTGLAETPNTPAYRAQTQQQLKEIITAMGNNQQALALLAPAYIESTNLDNRQEIADDLRRMSGIPVPGDRKGRMQAEAEQSKAAAEQAQIVKEKALAEVDKLEAEAKKINAEARKTDAEAVALERKNDLGDPEAETIGKHLANEAAAGGEEREQDAARDAEADDALAGALEAVQ